MSADAFEKEREYDVAPGRDEEGKYSDGDEVERQLEEVDPKAEAKLVRKLDFFLVPVVMLLYLLSFLDR
jgi:hypothetical protein